MFGAVTGSSEAQPRPGGTGRPSGPSGGERAPYTCRASPTAGVPVLQTGEATLLGEPETP